MVTGSVLVHSNCRLRGVIDDCSGWHGWREKRTNRPVLHNNVSVLMYGGEKDEVMLPHRPKKQHVKNGHMGRWKSSGERADRPRPIYKRPSSRM